MLYKNQPTRIKKPNIYQPVILQSLLLVVVFIGVALIWSKLLAYSIGAGGIICIIPNAWFAWFAFRYQGASQVDKIVQSFYRGEAGKIILSAAMFATVFTLFKELNGAVVMISYIVTLLLGLVFQVRFRVK